MSIAGIIDKQAWEEICLRCGQCCYEKIEYRGQYYLTDIPCNYLDSKTKLCRVYSQRCQLKEGCVALNPEIVKMGVLPKGCAYVQLVKDYKPPLECQYLPDNVLKSFENDN